MRFILAFILALPLFGQAVVNFKGPDQVARDYTLANHPRVLFDGDAGTITLRLKDPDGSGPLRNANYDTLPGTTLQSRVATSRTGCLVNGVIQHCRSVYGMATEAAMLYWMCNQCTVPWDGATTWGAFAKDLYLNLYEYGFKRWHGSHKFGDALAGDAGEDPGSMSDYGGTLGLQAVIGYGLVRGLMTAGERTTVAGYFLNGLMPGDYCEYPAKRTTVRVSKMVASNQIDIMDGASWPAGVDVGEEIEIKAYKDSTGAIITTNFPGNGYWSIQGTVKTKTATSITMAIGSGGSWMPNFQEGYLFVYEPAESDTCGMMGIFLTHGDWVRYTEPLYTINSRALAAPVAALDWDTVRTSATGTTETWTLSDCTTWAPPGYPTPTPSTPWKASIGGDWTTEVVLIEGQSGCDLTVRRGLYNHGWAKSLPANITLFQHKARGAHWWGTGVNNREMTRNQSVLAILLAFADDDPRAATWLTESANYFSEEMYKQAKKYFNIWNYSVGNYNIGRGVYYHRMAMMMKNAIASPAADFTDGNHLLHSGLMYPYWHLPWSPTELNDLGLEAFDSCTWKVNTSATTSNAGQFRDCSHIAILLQLTHPGEEITKQAWAWLTSDEMGHKFQTSSYWWTVNNSIEYMNESWALYFLLMAGYPTDIQTAADKTTLDLSYVAAHGDSQSNGGLGYKIGWSRTDWTTSATVAYMMNFDSFSDKMPSGDGLHTTGIGKNGWHIQSPQLPSDRQRAKNGNQMSGIYFDDGTKGTYYVQCVPPTTTEAMLVDGLCPGYTYPSYGTARAAFSHLASEYSILSKGGTPGSTVQDKHKLNWNWRHFSHIKGGTGTKDYVVEMWDFNRSEASPKHFYIRQPYVNDGQGTNGRRQTRSEAKIYWTEGDTRLSPDFTYVESRTGGTQGAVSKLTSKWLLTGGASVASLSILPVKLIDSGVSGTRKIEVCAHADASFPCSIKVGSTEYNFTSTQGTVAMSTAGGSTNSYKRIWLVFEQSTGEFHVRWENGITVAPVCTGNIICDAQGGTFTDGDIPLYTLQYAESGSLLQDCTTPLSSSNGTVSTFYYNNCLDSYDSLPANYYLDMVDSAKPFLIRGNATNTGVVWMWHRATTDLAEARADGTALTVTGGNHVALQIEDATEPIVNVLPIANARATDLSLTTTFSGSLGRLVACGLSEGTYKVTVGGIDHQTGISVGADETCIFSSGMSAGATVITRTAGASGNILVSPASVTASYTTGGTAPSNQTLTVSASGVTLGAWTATVTSGSPWLSVTSGGTTGNGTTQAAFNVSGLAVGTYQGNVRFATDTAGVTNSPVDVAVTLTVSEPGGINLTLSSASLTFATTEGAGNPANQTTNLAGVGGTLDNFTVNEVSGSGCAALTVTPGSGSANATLTFAVNNTGLLNASSPYVCNGTITSTTNGVLNSPLAWTATINVAASAAVTLSLGGPLSYSATVGGANPANQTLNFSSSAAIDNWSSSITYLQGSGWLSLSPSSGTTAANMTASVDVSSLSVAGQYCATVNIASTDPDVTNTPQTASVCVTMAAAAVAPQIEPPDPQDLTLTLGAAGALTLNILVGTGTAPFAWEVVDENALPPGITLSSASGSSTSLSGTPTTVGDFVVSVKATDDASETNTVQFIMRVRPPQNAADIDVTVLPFEGGALFRIAKTGLNASQAGKIVIRDDTGEVAANQTIPSGPAVRTVVVAGLINGPTYTYEVSYPTGTIASPSIIGARGIFTVDAVTGDSVNFGLSLTPPAGRSIVGVDVYLGTNEAEVASGGVTPTRLTCANPDPCEGSISTTKGFRFLRYVWRDGSDNNKGDSGVQKVRIR